MMIFPKRSDQVTVFVLFGQFVHCYGVRVNLNEAEIGEHTARLSEAHPHLQITTELVLDHRVFIVCQDPARFLHHRAQLFAVAALGAVVSLAFASRVDATLGRSPIDPAGRCGEWLT